MSNAAILVSAALSLALIAFCWRVSGAYRGLLSGRREVPVQWMIGGEVTKTASPRFSLALFPVLTAGMMAGFFAIVIVASGPAHWVVIAVQLFVGLFMAGLNAWFLARSTRN